MEPRERLTEGGWTPPWLHHQHLARYEWVGEFCRGKRVLDAACADGYGTRIITNSALAAFGCDIALEPLVASRHGSRVPVVAADALRFPFADRTFDTFVSFETIEHVPDDDGFVREAWRVLADDGLLVVSTPNRLIVNPGKTLNDAPFNPFHVREYADEELAALLRRYFGSVTLLGQRAWSRTYQRLLGALGSISPATAVRLHQVRKVAGIPLERRSLHIPRPYDAADAPEVLVAICRKR